MSFADIAARGWYEVRGYASRIGVTSLHDRPIRLSPGCFNLVMTWPFLCFMHEPARQYAWNRNGSLKVAEDHYGLRFAARIDYGTGGELMPGILDGRFN